MPRSISVFLSVLVLPVAMLAQSSHDTTFTMTDGAVLEAFFVLPAAPPPPAGYPAIVIVHGFAGSMENNRAAAMAFASQGYAATSYSVRGQGNSGGQFDFFTSPRVREDLRFVLDFTKSLRTVNPARVAVIGGSQGGIHAWAAAAYDMGVRTVVSIIANGRFDENWVENGAMNWTFARAIAVANVRFAPGLRETVNAAATSGDIAPVRRMLEDYSTAPREETVAIPVAILVSYYDGFFNQNAALRQFARIPTPKKIVTYPAGHALPGISNQRAYTDRIQAEWLAYWLKDDQRFAAVCSPDSGVVMFDAATGESRIFAVKDSAYWLAGRPSTPRLQQRTWYFTSSGISETQPLPPSQRNIGYVNLLGSTPEVFRSEPFATDMIIAGAHGSAVLHSDGTASQYQMNLVLYDVDQAGRALPVTRGHAQVSGNSSGSPETLHFDLCSVLHTVRAGHRLEARVHAGIGAFPNTQNDFGNYVLGPVQNSTNSLLIGGATPSSFTLHTIDPTPVAGIGAAPPHPAMRLAVAPNPVGPGVGTSSTVHFRFRSSGPVALRVYDALGRLVAAPYVGLPDDIETDVLFDCSPLHSGTYHVVLAETERHIGTRLLVVR